ncbi:MAG: recombination protein RecO [Campylobacterota bacterium]|nr:recombination protein RecO [Campylobacterota bacterium]
MQGYIINLYKVKDEDLIVSILTDDHFYTTYRFYGARHSNINIGFKIDFELETNLKGDIPRLKDVIQLSYPWILDNQKLYCWQRFLKLFYPHLKDVDFIDNFYIQLLDNLAHRMIKQNPKRAILEAYIKLCEFEGRLHTEYECLLCEQIIQNKISIIRGFLPIHSTCSYGRSFEFSQIENLFEQKSTIELDNNEVDYLFDILLQGL